MGKLAKNYFYNICYQILVLVAPIVTAPYLARVLGAELLGVSNYVVTVASVFTTVGLLGIQNYAIREIAYVKQDSKKLEETFYELYFVRLLLGAITTAVYIPYIFVSNYPSLMWIEYMYVVAFFIDPCWFYIGMEDMGKAVARNFFAKAVNVIGIFVLVKSKQDYTKYIFLLSFMTLFSSILAIPHLRKYFSISPRRIALRNIKIHLKGSVQLFWPQVATMIYLSVDKIMLEHFVSSSSVAYYDQAEKIVKIPLAFITVLSTVMMPRLASQFADRNAEQMKKYLSKTIEFSCFLAFPMMFGIAGVASSLIPWYLGGEFLPVVQAIQVLSPIVLLCSLVGISGDQYLVATKQTRIMTISYFCAAFVNVIINLLLIPRYSVVGAAIGTIAAYLVSMMIQYRTMLKKINVKSEIARAGLYFLKAMPMLICVYGIGKFYPANWKTTFAQIAAGIIVYFVTLVVIKDQTLSYLMEKVPGWRKGKGRIEK